MRSVGWLALGAVTAFAVTSGLSPRGNAADQKIERAPAFSAQQLTALPRADWITNGGNIFNQRYSPLDQINRGNVANLKAEWHIELGGSGVGPKYSGQGQPIVYDGVIYMSTGADDVFAIDVETGKILWTYKAHLDENNNRVCCGWSSRGVAIGDGRIYIGQLDGKLVALDQRTGKVVWSVQAERWQDNYTITSAALYFDGMVITGFGGADKGVQGRIKAFDAKTGKLKWTFYTVPNPGEFGHDTWPTDNDAWKYGGASIWQTPAVDPELGLIYFSTGNPGPSMNGAARAGDNLFSVSIVALDAKTGKYRWHFQQVHHDLWDYDSPNPVILFDTMIDGKPRKGLGEVSKTGWLYLLDRVTGKPLIGIEEEPVPQEPRQHTSPTQPFPVGDPIVPHDVEIQFEGHPLVNHGRIFTPFWTDTVAMRPTATGGANWPPSSYDPESNLFYVCAGDAIGGFHRDVKDVTTPTPGESFRGGQFVPVSAHHRGIFAAVDVRTNRLVWRQQWNDLCYSGSIVTAGGLLFIGRNDGRLTALDKTNGNLLWQFQTDAAINAAASTFEYKGTQYVAVLAAGSLFPGTKRGDSVWLFSLKGSVGPLAGFEQPTRGSQPVALKPPTRAADAGNGKKLYGQICQPCHGATGEGGHGGGAPLTARLTVADVLSIAANGKNQMPSFAATLSSDELQDIGTFIVQDLVPKRAP